MYPIPGVNYRSPYSFSWRKRLSLAILPGAATAILKGLLATCRVEVRGKEIWRVALESHGRLIVAFWHEAMALAASHFCNTGFHTLTSYSYDGELGARIVRRFGLYAVRGSSSRGGSDALQGLERALDRVQAVGFTLDGPRGPRRAAKPGVAILSARTGTPIIPLAFVVHPAWRLHSWDRFPVPRPGARVVSAYGPIVAAARGVSERDVETTRAAVEQALNALHAGLEAELGIEPFAPGDAKGRS